MSGRTPVVLALVLATGVGSGCHLMGGVYLLDESTGTFKIHLPRDLLLQTRTVHAVAVIELLGV